MLQVRILTEDIPTIQRDRFYHPQPHIMMRMHALALHHEGESAARIAQLLHRDARTIRGCLIKYRDGGLKAVYEYEKHKHESELEEYSELIEKNIEKTTAQKCSRGWCHHRRIDWHQTQSNTDSRVSQKKEIRCLKTGSIPCNADPVAQKEFLENTIEPVISAAKRDEVELYYVDAAHFAMGAFLGYLWSKVRVSIRTPSGRKRYNILGTYHAIRGTMITVTNDTDINSSSGIKLLGKLSLLHSGRVIKVILGNAACQRCHWVRMCVTLLGIELIFLPSYSPNLNLIERYWKFLKKKCLYNHFYDDFECFRNAIDDCIANSNEKYRNELKTLMTLNFQPFEHVQFLAV